MESELKNFGESVIPQSIQKAKTIINTIAISYAKVERGFSTMNLIHSDRSNCFKVENVTHLMIICLDGLPFHF